MFDGLECKYPVAVLAAAAIARGIVNNVDDFGFHEIVKKVFWSALFFLMDEDLRLCRMLLIHCRKHAFMSSFRISMGNISTSWVCRNKNIPVPLLTA